jgi:hypothetical protein
VQTVGEVRGINKENFPEKFIEFPGLSPRNLEKIPEGKVKSKNAKSIFKI